MVNDAFRFCSNLAFNGNILKSGHIYLPDSHKQFHKNCGCFNKKYKNLPMNS